MKSFKEYILMSEEARIGTLNIFDVDDTLFKTNTKISVIKNGRVIKKLTNQEYNTYEKKPGEELDFSDFRSAEKFAEDSVPMRKMLAKAKAIVTNSFKNPASRCIILTARADFDDKETFLNVFRKYGFDMDRIRVERAGNISGGGPSGPAKAIVIRKYLDAHHPGHHFGKVRFFDDAVSNLDHFLKLKKEYPEVTFEAYLVKEDGSVLNYGN